MINILSIYFHNPKPEVFKRILSWCVRHDYEPITLERLLVLLRDEKNKSAKGKYLYVSLDDGWRGNLKLLPVIEELSIPITIFVATEPLTSGNYWWEFVSKERGAEGREAFKKLPSEEFYSQLSEIKRKIHLERSSMTRDELIQISKNPLVSIQSHTVNHPILTTQSDEVLKRELVDSKTILEQLTGKSVFAFSYPNGSLSDREVEACRSVYDCAFTTESSRPKIGDELITIPRIALTDDYYRNILKITGMWKIIKKLLR